MGSKTILICNAQTLLVEGVKSLLVALDDFIVTKILVTEDLILAQEIKQSKPDIVIMDDETAFLIDPTQFLEIFRAAPSLRLIILDRKISRMDIYSKRELFISHPDHFIEALI